MDAVGKLALDVATRVDDGGLIAVGLNKVENRQHKVVDVADVVPRVRQIPSEHFAILVLVDVRLDHEVLLLIIIVQVLHVEVDLVAEEVPWDLATHILVVAVGVDTHNDRGHFASISLNFSYDFRLIVYVVATDLAADCVQFRNLGDDFLKSAIDFSVLLKTLLFLQLGAHLEFKLFFSFSTFFLQRSLLFTHFCLEFLAFFLQLDQFILSCSFLSI